MKIEKKDGCILATGEKIPVTIKFKKVSADELKQLEKNKKLICDSDLCPLKGNLCETLRDLDFPDDPILTLNDFCFRVSTSDIDPKVVEQELYIISDDEIYVPQGTKEELVSLIGIKEETKD